MSEQSCGPNKEPDVAVTRTWEQNSLLLFDVKLFDKPWG